MDSATIALAMNVVNVLLPYVSKGAEEFASKVGDAAYEKARMLLSTLKEKWQGDKEASESLACFEEKPERYQPVLTDILQEKLSQDKDFASQVSRLLQEMGPALQVIQTMEKGTGITALKAGEFHRGTANVSQEITTGEDVIGAEIDTIG